MQVVNIAAYKFIALDRSRLSELRERLKDEALRQQLKGTILLSSEGINLFLAGKPPAIERYKKFLTRWQEFSDLWFKESHSTYQPFTRLLVRIKHEIIAMGREEIQPEKQTVPHLAPGTLKKWYDEGKKMLVLDTRNNYEVELGSFINAINLGIKNFREFPVALGQLPESAKSEPIITFCTGGVRCEKAGELMRQQGFKEVYQLEGGILNYFEKCAGEYFDGECFVFDKRVALNKNLQETQTKQCFACRAPVAAMHQNQNQCPNCNTIGQMG